MRVKLFEILEGFKNNFIKAMVTGYQILDKFVLEHMKQVETLLLAELTREADNSAEKELAKLMAKLKS